MPRTKAAGYCFGRIPERPKMGRILVRRNLNLFFGHKKYFFRKTFETKLFEQYFIFSVLDFHSRNIFFEEASALLVFLKSAGKVNISVLCFLQKAHFLPLKVKILKKILK